MQKILDKLQIEKYLKGDKTQKALKYFQYAAIAVGTYKILGFTCCTLSRIFNHFIAPGADLFSRYGKCYALISGGSQGLGKEYALALAKRGFDLILLARGRENLEQAKKEINQLHPNRDVQIFEFDFSTQAEAAYDKLVEQVSNFNVGIVINNVGTFTMDLLPDLNHQKLIQLLSINMFAQTLLTQKMIPLLRARGKRSAIYFVGSEAGDFPRSRFSVYAATKAYGNQLARSLELDLKNTNIDVRLFVPGPTYTPLLKNLVSADYPKTIDGRFFVCQPQDVVEQHLRKSLRYKEVWGTIKHGSLHFTLRNFRCVYDTLKGE